MSGYKMHEGLLLGILLLKVYEPHFKSARGTSLSRSIARGRLFEMHFVWDFYKQPIESPMRVVTACLASELYEQLDYDRVTYFLLRTRDKVNSCHGRTAL